MDVIVVTPREKELLDILMQSDKPLSRDQIAQVGGRKSLSPHDFTLLDRLADKKLIKHSISSAAPGRGRYMYEAVK